MRFDTQIAKFVLPNSVRVVCEHVPYVHSVAVGIWCHTGSRMESPQESGISHLIEHMLFKGTEKRTAEQIAREIEGKGGHLNAFTDREITCFYARTLAEELPTALDVLSDMFTNSLIKPEDLELEKNVIHEEIRKYEDSPEDHIHDLHTRKRWGDHPLGRPIIGTHESLSSFQREHLKDYLKRRYVAGKTLVAVAGKVEPEELRKLCEEKLSSLTGDFELPNEPPPNANPGEFLVPKNVEEVHFCIGGDSVTLYDERRYALGILDAILGGSMSSRLFQEIREKRGLVYAVGSYAALYREAGSFTIYGGTSLQTWEQVKELVAKEIQKMRSEDVADDELERAKKMIKGSIVLGMESMNARMHRIAKNELVYGRDIPIEETLAKIEAVTQKEIRTLAEEFLNPEKMTTTAIGPF